MSAASEMRKASHAVASSESSTAKTVESFSVSVDAKKENNDAGKPAPFLTLTFSKKQRYVNNGLYVLQLVVAILTLTLAAIVDHSAGVVFALFLVIILVAAFIDAHLGVFTPCLESDPWTSQNITIRATWEFARFALFFLTAIFLIMRLASLDPSIASFPSACPNSFACVRVSANDTTNVNADSLSAQIFHTSSEELRKHGHRVADSGLRWQHIHTTTNPHGEILSHYRFVHGFWGVPDDIVIKYSCYRGIGAVAGPALVEVQAQSRLGHRHDAVELLRDKVAIFLHSMENGEDDYISELCKA